MMKGWANRAMQIACIEMEKEIKGSMADEFLHRLHTTERKLNYLLPNWNIQKIAGLTTIKDHFGIPGDDPEAQVNHQDRIEREIEKAGFNPNRFEEETDYVDQVHSMDWFVLRNRERVEWGYAGQVGKRGGILKRLEA